MPSQKIYPVIFTLNSTKSLRELAGKYYEEIDVAIQMTLSRRPRHGPSFGKNLRAITLSPPTGRIVVVYEFDNDAVYVVRVMGVLTSQN